jgi:hypothetical protein
LKSEGSNPDPLHESGCYGPNLYQVNEYSGSAEAQRFLFSDAKPYVKVNFIQFSSFNLDVL